MAKLVLQSALVAMFCFVSTAGTMRLDCTPAPSACPGCENAVGLYECQLKFDEILSKYGVTSDTTWSM